MWLFDEAAWGPAPPYRSPLPVEDVADVAFITCQVTPAREEAG